MNIKIKINNKIIANINPRNKKTTIINGNVRASKIL